MEFMSTWKYTRSLLGQFEHLLQCIFHTLHVLYDQFEQLILINKSFFITMLQLRSFHCHLLVT